MAERPTRVRELILSDYRAFSGLRGDGPLKRRMLALPRMLLNPSLHAVVLVRLANGSPRWLHWFWRNVLMWKHSMELVYRSSIGPGLVLPHPIGIVIGRDVRIGRDARIMHNVVIGPNFLDDRMPVIGDAVELCTGSMIFGGVAIGDRALIGAGAFVDFDVPADHVASAPRAKLLPARVTPARPGAGTAGQ